MKKLLALILLFALLPLPAKVRAEEGVPERPEYTSMTRVTMEYFSTVSMLQIFDDFADPERVAAFEDTWSEVLRLLERLDGAFSLSKPDSDVSRFNALPAGGSVLVSEDTERLIGLVRGVYDATGGCYDPTVAPLVDLFGFTPRFSSRSYRPSAGYDRERVNGALPLPDDETVEALRPLIGFSGVSVYEGRLYKNTPPILLYGGAYQQSMDLGGIAKGYAVDLVMEFLRERGYAYGYFSCGGSSIGILSRAVSSAGAPGKAQWGVGVQYPRFGSEQQVLLRLFTNDVCLSTSGDYEHFYTQGGVRYSHLIDPAQGRPVNMPVNGVQSGVCSATVLGENAAVCDALSTALCVMGPERAVAFMNGPDYPEYSYLMILYSDDLPYCEIVTDLPAERYEVLDPERFHVACETGPDGAVLYTGNLRNSG